MHPLLPLVIFLGGVALLFAARGPSRKSLQNAARRRELEAWNASGPTQRTHIAPNAPHTSSGPHEQSGMGHTHQNLAPFSNPE